MPLFFGAIFFVLGTLRSRVIALGKPPDKFSRALRSYGTVWAVGEGYLMLGIRSLLDGTALKKDSGVIVTLASLLWVAVVTAFGVTRNRSRRAPNPCRSESST